jgi:hypothetical protein
MAICQKEKKSDVCGYAAIEKIKIWTRVLDKSFELAESTCGFYLQMLARTKADLQAYTFVQVLSFQHANQLCYKAIWNICK